MAKKILESSLTVKTAGELVHEALESVREVIGHILDDKAHNVIETIKYAATKIIKKAEKDLNPKGLKHTAKRAIRKASKELIPAAKPKVKKAKPKSQKKVVAKPVKAARKPARKPAKKAARKPAKKAVSRKR